MTNPSNQPYYSTGFPTTYGYPVYYRATQPQGGMNHPTTTYVPNIPSGSTINGGMPSQSQGVTLPGQIPIEQSFVENILRLNINKMVTIYMTFENNSEWNAKVFRGKLEAAGRDHIIISDPKTGMRYLLLMVNLDYITFEEPLNYEYPF